MNVRASYDRVAREYARHIAGELAQKPFDREMLMGAEVRHIDDWWEMPVDLDFVFFTGPEMEGYLRTAGFSEIESWERDPYPEIEVQTRRADMLARAPGT